MELVDVLKEWGPAGVIFMGGVYGVGWVGKRWWADWQQARKDALTEREARMRKLEADIASMWTEVRLGLLECRADSIIGDDHLQSMKNIAGEYRMLLHGILGNNRNPPAELKPLDERWYELRKKIHDYKNDKASRLQEEARMMERLKLMPAAQK